jgi:hypothetical protein
VVAVILRLPLWRERVTRVRRCDYCGVWLYHRRSRTCHAHSDLPALDPLRRPELAVPCQPVEPHGPRGARPPSGAPPNTEVRGA